MSMVGSRTGALKLSQLSTMTRKSFSEISQAENNDMAKSYTTAMIAAESKAGIPSAAEYSVYNSYVKTAHSAPKYTMAFKHQNGLKDNFPAPNAYDIQEADKSLASSYMARNYNRSLVNESQINKANGPGAYRPEEAMQSYKNKGQTLSGRPNDNNINKNPGVGSYNIAVDEQLHGGCMGKRYEAFQNMYNQGSQNNPGVGSYDIGNKKIGGIGFPKQTYQTKIDNIPGPGAYNVKPQRSSSKSNKCSFGIRFKGNTF